MKALAWGIAALVLAWLVRGLSLPEHRPDRFDECVSCQQDWPCQSSLGLECGH